MGKISSYSPTSVAKRSDTILGVNNQGSTPVTTKFTEDNLITRATGGIGFFGNAAAEGGATGTTPTVVTKFTTVLEEKTFASTAANLYIEIPTGESGTYRLEAELDVMNDTNAAIFCIRLTKNGVNISGTLRQSTAQAANRPVGLSTTWEAAYVQGDRIRLECYKAAPAPTTGIDTYINGRLRAIKIRSNA